MAGVAFAPVPLKVIDWVEGETPRLLSVIVNCSLLSEPTDRGWKVMLRVQMSLGAKLKADEQVPPDC